MQQHQKYRLFVEELPRYEMKLCKTIRIVCRRGCGAETEWLCMMLANYNEWVSVRNSNAYNFEVFEFITRPGNERNTYNSLWVSTLNWIRNYGGKLKFISQASGQASAPISPKAEICFEINGINRTPNWSASGALEILPPHTVLVNKPVQWKSTWVP